MRTSTRRAWVSVAGSLGAVISLVAIDSSRRIPSRKDCSNACLCLPSSREPQVGLLSLGLNPSQQTIVKLRSLDLGQVNRAEAALPGVGGKGQNAAKAAATFLKTLDGRHSSEGARPDSAVTVAQFLGGSTGEVIESHLNKLGVHQVTKRVFAATRQTMTLIDYPRDASKGPTVTELVMPSEQLVETEVEELLKKILPSVPKQKGIMLMGTWPKGVASGFYSSVARAKAPDSIVLMDAFNPVDEISAILSEGHIDVYKVNAFELCTLMGAEGLKEGSVTGDQVQKAVEKAFDKFQGVQNFAITDGAGNAYFFSRHGEALQFCVPKVFCRNPIGAGDTVAGVMLAAFCSNYVATLPDAMRLGLAAASAKVQIEDEGGIFDVEEMQRLNDLITVRKLPGLVS